MNTPLQVLKAYWGYEAFRSPQEAIIQHVLAGRDTLALLPTGGGKSICFQVPALCREGMCLVISPLIALMKDQVERLNRMGIPATYLNSSMPRRVIDHKLQLAMEGQYKFLYLAPERISSEMFLMRLPRLNVQLLAVDEAHCISQWGYDFRPAYLEIHQIRAQCPEVPLIALTASATPRVKEDIQQQLRMREPGVFQKSFRRSNLRYFVLQDEQVLARIGEIVQRTQGTGIVYARTRKRVAAISQWLKERGVSAAAYHGGMKNSQRSEVQEAWIQGTHRVVVATNAFGMGIDKADVRFVIHYNLPFDLESYYQEAGRGGRDGKTALAIAFSNPVDIGEMKRWEAQRYPSWDQLRQHYHQLCAFYQLPRGQAHPGWLPFDMPGLVDYTGSSALQVYRSLHLLQREGLIQLNEESDDFSYVQVTAAPEDLLRYKSQEAHRAPLVDFILRTLGGEVYIQEKRFLPHHWARQLGVSQQLLAQQLDRLVQYGLIHHQPARSQPVIRFPVPHHELNQKALNWDIYTFLRQQSQERLDQVLAYAESTSTCRSLMIQHYFGEQAHEPCGRCDVCIGRHKTKVSQREFHRIRRAFMALLADQSLTYREALTRLQTGTPSQREKVLRYLIDKRIVHIDLQGTLSLT